jgi:NitT/TauT family transport system permease protein
VSAEAGSVSEAGADWRPRRPPDLVLAVLTPLLLVVLWELLVKAGPLDHRFFPPPSKILPAAEGLVRSGELWLHVRSSLLRIVLGFMIGSLAAVPVGLALGALRLLRVMFEPVLSGLYVIPKIAILPLVMMIFGIDDKSKIAIVALATFFVVAINTLEGVRQVEPVLIEAGRNFGARGLQMFRHVILPGALPSIFTGLRLGAGAALLVIIAAEFVAANEGIGYLIWRSWTTLVTENMFVGFAVIALLGVLFSWLLQTVARLVMPWQAEQVDLGATAADNV